MEMYLIHPQIFEDNRICSTAKLLFSLICNLSIKDGVCTASNNYLGEKLSLKKERVSKLITELVKYDYIKSECKYKENTKHYFEERILTPLSLNFTIPININDYTYSIKKLYPMSFNDVGISLNDGTDLSKTSNAVELPIIKNDVGMSLNDGTQLNDNTPMSLNAYVIHNNNNNNNIDTKVSKKKIKKVFIPPTLEEVENYCLEKGYSKTLANKIFDSYDCADWHDSRGTKILNWKQKCINVWFNNENKIKYKDIETKKETILEVRDWSKATPEEIAEAQKNIVTKITYRR